ncbi:AMIN-like domain-containing (lipo)protein [Saccharothrix algeriensis]|uniref:AMIN-like domain-containing protein n=1 Tax=Saccharothrix algeriensis TaxID=173560 RepID=A0A8T8HUQ0_9PSEU|nr:hypothetical protein [Saccharothrix algeriensis]MBM7813627.1 hypothetical protein [Saccharothrix algeriensis]QTR02111.1 hypothetical protein J7S33_23230 [Saccharothrix algeriensis]
MIRRIAVSVFALISALVVVVAPAASAAPAACAVDWGSLEKRNPPTTRGNLVDIRSGQQDCYDRLVFDFRGENDGYIVRYVDEVHEDPTGRPVPLRGGAKLLVIAESPAYDDNGNPTYTYPNRDELVDVTGYATFRQVAWAGSFEGQTSVGLGVRARLPFRVFTLPGRLVVDVAHSW